MQLYKNLPIGYLFTCLCANLDIRQECLSSTAQLCVLRNRPIHPSTCPAPQPLLLAYNPTRATFRRDQLGGLATAPDRPPAHSGTAKHGRQRRRLDHLSYGDRVGGYSAAVSDPLPSVRLSPPAGGAAVRSSSWSLPVRGTEARPADAGRDRGRPTRSGLGAAATDGAVCRVQARPAPILSLSESAYNST